MRSSVEKMKLKVIMNTADSFQGQRIVTRTRKTEHITPALRDLNWLPVNQRIAHKMMSLPYKCYRGTAPEYLQELIPRYTPARSLRSSSQPLLRIPSADEKHTKKHFGFRAFSNSAPKLWNSGIRQVIMDTADRHGGQHCVPCPVDHGQIRLD